MDGSQVLGVGLATLAHALEKRKAALLAELRQVERDMMSVEDTLAAAERMGFSSTDLPASPAGAAHPSQQQKGTGRRHGTRPTLGTNTCFRHPGLRDPQGGPGLHRRTIQGRRPTQHRDRDHPEEPRRD